jgi:hypothetical protein
MSEVADPKPDVSSLLIAGLLLAALEFLRRHSLARPTSAEILEATAAGRAQAYEYRRQILDLLPSLQRSPGRPAAPPAADVGAAELTRAVLRFVMEHPGCVDGGQGRRRYSDDFRRFILELREKHAEMNLEIFSNVVQVPLGTMEDWIRCAAAQVPLELPVPAPVFDPASPRIQTVLDAWKRWSGSFIGFCEHVQVNLRIPYGRETIAQILELHRMRSPRRRPGRGPDEEALRGQFMTFFPGAQWVGDGSALSITINGKTFTFNLELDVDCHTDAFVGASVRKEEDAQAVVEALEDGIETTGARPLALLLDNKLCNHTDEVKEALGDTIGIRATLKRPQNKAHVEGAFGLFQQTAPPLEIDAASEEEMAKRMLEIIIQIWARTLNHRPRQDCLGRSRVELYRGEQPTPEQIEEARAALEERRRKQELAEQTRRARQDPVVRKILDDAFARLGLDDPDGNIRAAIAGFPRDAVLAGLAVFQGKRAAATLPPGVDARYLLGIVRNISNEDEGIKIADILLRTRLEARDLALSSLQSSCDAITRSSRSAGDQLKAVLDHALFSGPGIDRVFWLDGASRIILDRGEAERDPLIREAARHIHTTYRVPYSERLESARRIIAKTTPIPDGARSST